MTSKRASAIFIVVETVELWMAMLYDRSINFVTVVAKFCHKTKFVCHNAYGMDFD